GTFSAANLGTFNRTGGSVNVIGTLNNAGSTLDIGSAGIFGAGGLTSLGINTFRGTILSGTVVSGDATPLTMFTSWSALDGVTLGDATHNALTLTTGLSVAIDNGITLADGFALNFGSSGWNMNGNSEIVTPGTATINIAGGTLNSNLAGSVLTIGDGITITGRGTVNGDANASIFNYGTLDASISGQNLTVAVSGTGTLTNNGILRSSTGNLVLSGVTTLAGKLDVGTSVSTSNTSLTNSGTITGAGTLNLGAANTLTNDGFINPAGVNGTGTLSITGNLLNSPTGKVQMEINGTTAGQYDVLAVSGTADITNGQLLLGGTGGVGSYPVLTATSVTGTFPSVGGLFTLTQTNNTSNLTLAVTANKAAGYTYWDGGAGTLNWLDDANWSTDLAPSASTSLYLPST
ncbi:MAG: hypothetical protein Q8M66_04025, partial [Actinomycetota bacterium]|nr:hypothetical protein [Actinomycetota bacterium]